MRRTRIFATLLSMASLAVSAQPVNAQQTYRSVTQQMQSVSFSRYADGESVADGLKDVQKQLEEQAKEFEKTTKKYDEKFDDLKDVGKDVEKHGEEIGDIQDGLKLKVDTGTSASTMKLSGRIHADYWGFPGSDAGINAIEGNPDGPEDQIGFRRLRFGVAGKLPANMLYKIEMEFAGGNNAEFRDAYLGWDHVPFMGRVLLGNQKRPYGYDHLNSSRYNIMLERPFIIEAFNQDARRFGLQSYNVSENQKWNWRYGVFNQRLIQDEGTYRGDHLQLEMAARLANTFWYDEASGGRGYGHWAISGSLANPDGLAGADNEARFRHRPEARSVNRWIDTGAIVGADNYQLGGLETVLNFGSLQLVGEYQSVWMDRQAGFGNELHFDGGYVQAAWFLTGEHMPWDRDSGTLGRIKPHEDFFRVKTDCGIGRGLGAWQVAARWSRGDLVDEDIAGGIGEAYTFGLNWYWNSNARMQFNYINGNIENNRGRSGEYEIVGMRMMVDF